MRHKSHVHHAIRGLAAVSGCLLALAGYAQTNFKPHPNGFWKIHPPANFKGEFGGEDVIGLANHQHITTDCSIAWKNKDKFYCFSSQMSSQFVQENPGAYLPAAAAFWAQSRPRQSTDGRPDANSVASGTATAR